MFFVLANLLSCCIAYAALMIQPQGAWDNSTLTGIETATATLITLSVVTSLVTLFPVRRRNLSYWWLAPPPGPGAGGGFRMQYRPDLIEGYPATSGLDLAPAHPPKISRV